MTIEDVFRVKDRGIIVTGRVEQGVLRIHEAIRLTGGTKPDLITTAAGLDIFHRRSPDAPIGILLDGIQPDQVEIGMVVTTEGVSQS